jgi:hypothetical protein
MKGTEDLGEEAVVILSVFTHLRTPYKYLPVSA